MSSSPTDVLVDVAMPQMGVSVAEGTVVEWRKQVGDWVERDEVIASISTDKIDTDVECPATGRVQEILVPEGTTVDVGVVLARIATDARPGEAHRDEAPSGNGLAPHGENVLESEAALAAPGAPGELLGDAEPTGTASAQEGAAAPARAGGARRYSPVVLRIAAEHGIDLEQVQGTGREGRVRKQDVLAVVANGTAAAEAAPEPPMHIESPSTPDAPLAPRRREPRLGGAAAPAPAPGGTTSAPLSRMRRTIGERMVESLRTAATCTTIIEADLSRIEVARARLGLTYLPFVARATIDALRAFPALNATLEGDVLTRYDAVHLGIAVSLGEEGLIVPVIRDAQELAVEGLARRIRDVAQRGREGALAPDEVRGGTFTITNPGQYGSLMATPVINQPQVAILDAEAVVKRPVVVTDPLGNDAVAIRPMTYFCLSWDHRALDGALAAQFLAAIRRRLETWPLD